MKADIFDAERSTGTGGKATRRQPPPRWRPPLGGERRIEVHLAMGPNGALGISAVWEHTAWGSDGVLIAESPAPRVPAGTRAALCAVAAAVASHLGCQQGARIEFALDSATGLFRVRSATPIRRPTAVEPAAMAVRERSDSGLSANLNRDFANGTRAGTGTASPIEAHAPQPRNHPRGNHVLQLRLRGSRPGMALVVEGVTRGDALRRAYLTLSRMPDADRDAHLRLLQRLIAAPHYCAGLTGSALMQSLRHPRARIALQ